MIPRLHYINPDDNYKQWMPVLEDLLANGLPLFQLRLKGVSDMEILDISRKVRKLTHAWGAKFIMNDYVSVAKVVNADGVHLGQDDLDTKAARIIMGPKAIIGATANTYEEVEEIIERNAADYIGLGPFRETSTKETTGPILGLEGYKLILQKMNTELASLPIIAIGGIIESDVEEIMDLGMHGIAVSSAIAKAENPVEMMKSLKVEERCKN